MSLFVPFSLSNMGLDRAILINSVRFETIRDNPKQFEKFQLNLAQFSSIQLNSAGYVDFYAKIFLILYPWSWNCHKWKYQRIRFFYVLFSLLFRKSCTAINILNSKLIFIPFQILMTLLMQQWITINLKMLLPVLWLVAISNTIKIRKDSKFIIFLKPLKWLLNGFKS